MTTGNKRKKNYDQFFSISLFFAKKIQTHAL